MAPSCVVELTTTVGLRSEPGDVGHRPWRSNALQVSEWNPNLRWHKLMVPLEELLAANSLNASALPPTRGGRRDHFVKGLRNFPVSRGAAEAAARPEGCLCYSVACV